MNDIAELFAIIGIVTLVPTAFTASVWVALQILTSLGAL